MAGASKFIAFYLPQFHPIPENDEWWGKGFTDWTNVAKARPLFRGHYQPHIPADLGFYDLRLEETRVAQAELAREHGIYGFCYYHYWFNGKMLLERPFNEVLNSGRPDFPFCLCWANENWTRRWDGLDAEILIGQDYSHYQADRHVEWLMKAFSDPRYINIDGVPLFLIYRSDQLPNLKCTVERIRAAVQYHGLKGIYLCAVKNTQFSLSDDEAISSGFDALVDFQPNSKQVPLLKRGLSSIKRAIFRRQRSNCNLLPYREFVATIMRAPAPRNKTFPCVFPSWDNSPRKSMGATVIQNADSHLFREFILSARGKIAGYNEQEQLIFVNAWNEWAEGCYLEPDLRNGRNFLNVLKFVANQ